jgi:chemotaxis protein histidine kinase CheA
MPSDLLEEFVFDSREHLTNASNQLLSLEKNPGSLDNLNALMGTFHTIKGNSGFVNQRHLYELLHSAESLLQTVRDNNERGCPPEVVEVLFQVLDTSEAIMTRLEHDEDDEVDWLPNLLDAIKESTASLEWGGAAGNTEGNVPESSEAGEEQEGTSREEESPAEIAPEAYGAASPEAEETSHKEPEPAAGFEEAGEEAGEEPGEEPSEESASSPAGEPAGEEVPTLLNPGETIQYLKLEDGELSEKGDAYLLDSMILMDKGDGKEGLILDLRDIRYLASPEARVLEQLSLAWGDRLAVVISQEEQKDLARVFMVLDFRGGKGFYPEKENAYAALEGEA